MDQLDADSIIADLRERIAALPNVADFCRRSGLPQGSLSKLVYESRNSHSIHWLARVDRALREHGEKSA